MPNAQASLTSSWPSKPGAQFDIVINMSGAIIPADAGVKIVDWDIPDPIGVPYKDFT